MSAVSSQMEMEGDKSARAPPKNDFLTAFIPFNLCAYQSRLNFTCHVKG